MSIASARSNVARVQKALADLRGKDATEAKKEADLVSKTNKATTDAQKATNANTMSQKLREVERHTNAMASVQQKRAGFAKDVSTRTTELNRYLAEQTKEEERERKKLAEEDRKQQTRRTEQLNDLALQLRFL